MRQVIVDIERFCHKDIVQGEVVPRVLKKMDGGNLLWAGYLVLGLCARTDGLTVGVEVDDEDEEEFGQALRELLAEPELKEIITLTGHRLEWRPEVTMEERVEMQAYARKHQVLMRRISPPTG